MIQRMDDCPIIALDVDGVLNPMGGNPAKLHRRGFVKHKGIEVQNLTVDVWLHPDHGALLQQLARAIQGELMWATTWNNDANVHIAPKIGLPTLPVIHVTPPFRWKDPTHWKRREVVAAAGERPLIWLDDQFTAFDGPWAAARGDTLLVLTKDTIGFTEKHCAMIEEYWRTRMSASIAESGA